LSARLPDSGLGEMMQAPNELPLFHLPDWLPFVEIARKAGTGSHLRLVAQRALQPSYALGTTHRLAGNLACEYKSAGCGKPDAAGSFWGSGPAPRTTRTHQSECREVLVGRAA